MGKDVCSLRQDRTYLLGEGDNPVLSASRSAVESSEVLIIGIETYPAIGRERRAKLS